MKSSAFSTRPGLHGAQNRTRAFGFSLIELMVALALGTFLIGGLILTYASGRAASIDAENLSRVQENMRFVSDHLLRDVRNAGFRDQLTLTFEQYENIGTQYAKVDGDALVIRYAGRSHCAQSREDFNLLTELTLVENRYFVEGGRLRCTGQAAGNSGTADMVDGVTAVSFQLIRPTGAPASDVCSFDTDTDLLTACTGVILNLTFSGIGANQPARTASLRASFRNVLVDRIYGRGS